MTNLCRAGIALFSNNPITCTWGGGNGSWTDTSLAGWDGGPPVSGDHVTIDSGTVSINVAGVGNLGSLTLSGGTLTSAGAIHVWNISGGITMAGDTLQSNCGASDQNGPQLEWNRASSTAQSRHAATVSKSPLAKSGAALEFTCTRGIAAMSDGVTFTVEWRDSLTTGTWSNAVVTKHILSVQTVRASVAAGAGAGRFPRLKVSKP